MTLREKLSLFLAIVVALPLCCSCTPSLRSLGRLSSCQHRQRVCSRRLSGWGKSSFRQRSFSAYCLSCTRAYQNAAAARLIASRSSAVGGTAIEGRN
jgi:hypothetical protein